MKFSIVTVVKDSVDTIENCMISVQSQIYDSFEHIIIDGKSTDGTLEKIALLRDHKTFMLSREDSGLYDALNNSKNLITGEYVILLHSDDVFTNINVLKDIAMELEEHPTIDALFCGIEFQNHKNAIVRKWKSKAFSFVGYRMGWSPPHTGIVFRESTYKILLPFNLEYKIASDYDFVIRFLSSSKNYAFSSLQITIMTLGGASTNYRNYFTTLMEDIHITLDHRLFFLSPFLKRLYKICQLC